MHVIPLTLADANASSSRGSIGTISHVWGAASPSDVSWTKRLVGVAIAGRPLARMTDQDRTLEVLRICTDGTQNACSFLYGAVRRAAFAMGFARVVTFTLPEEGGASLRASGWEAGDRVRGRRMGALPNIGLVKNDHNRPLGPKHRYAVENPTALPGRYRSRSWNCGRRRPCRGRPVRVASPGVGLATSFERFGPERNGDDAAPSATRSRWSLPS